MIDPDTLSVLRAPGTREELRLANGPEAGYGGDYLVGVSSGRRIPLRNGIPVFLDVQDLHGRNQKYERFYNRIAPLYDTGTRIYVAVHGLSEDAGRAEFLSELEIKDGDRVLEVSIGTGANLRYLNPAAQFWGLDLSWGMLRQCQKQLRRMHRQAILVLGAAEQLPFQDNAFDVVFQVGGIGTFNDRAGAIREMVRVARPGTKIVIVDEVEMTRQQRGPVGVRTRLGWLIYARPRVPVDRPIPDLVPSGMQDLTMKTISNGDFYCLSFRKPQAGA